MRVYISADIEGVGCVVRSEHSSVTGRDYPIARRLMTGEVNAAIRGAFDAGATEVVVSDSHNVGLNLLVEDLDERASLIMGSPRPLCMMEGIGEGFDVVFLVGYHGKAGTPDSPIVHIFTGRVQEVRANGVSIGEIGISAALAGFYGAPVALVAGDRGAAAEARALLGEEVETVAVKEGIGNYAAKCVHPKRAQALIFEAARRATARGPSLSAFTIPGAVELDVTFTTTSGADRVLRMPGTSRLSDGRTVRYNAPDFLQAFKAFNVMADLLDLVAFI